MSNMAPSTNADLFTIYKFRDFHKAGTHFLILGEEHAAYGKDLVIMQFHKISTNEHDTHNVFPLLVRRLNYRLAIEQAMPTDERVTVEYVIEMLVTLWNHARTSPSKAYPFGNLSARLSRYSNIVRNVVSLKCSAPFFMNYLKIRGLDV